MANKIQIPNVEYEYIKRRADVLLNNVQERVIIVNAASGYGKTQLLANYVASSDVESAWYSLSKTDNDLVLFVDNLTKAVKMDIGNEKERFQLALSEKEQIDVLMERLVLWFDEKIDCLNIILDDFQEISNPDIYILIDVLVETLGEKIKFFIIVNRSLTDFLKSYVERGRAVYIATEELEFSRNDIERILKKYVGEDILSHSAELVYDCTEGWPVGVTQILLQLKQSRKKRTIHLIENICKDLEVSDYIMTKIYKLLPFEIQMFLKKTAVLDYMTGPVCNKILEIYDSESLLKYLVHEKLFVQSLGSNSSLYRYHSLFQRFLISLLSEAEKKESLRKAALYYLKTDDKLQAAEYGCQAQASDIVQAVIEVLGEELLDEKLNNTLKQWFLFLKEQNWELSVKARFIYGKYLWTTGNTIEAKEYIISAAKAFFEEGRTQEYKKVLMFMAACERKAGNVKLAENYLEQAEQYREKYWNDVAETVCAERVKQACCLHCQEKAISVIEFWKKKEVKFKEGSFLFMADYVLNNSSENMDYDFEMTGIEEGFLLENCLLAERLEQEYQSENYEQVIKTAVKIIRNAEYETVQTVIAWRMLAVFSWENRNYRKAVEQMRNGEGFIYRNQIQLQNFSEKHQRILEEIKYLKINSVDSRILLQQKVEQKESSESLSDKIKVQCLKRFSVVLPEKKEEIKWRTKKAQELFAYLFHLQGEGRSREDLIELLWPEAGAKSAAALFHTTLYSVRQGFEQEGIKDIILCEKRKYSLNMKIVSSDLQVLELYLQNIEFGGEDDNQIVIHYPGGYMENTGYLWAYSMAKHLENEYLRVCKTGALRRLKEQKNESALSLLKGMLEIDPYDDEIIGLYIRCLYINGERTEAKQQYERIIKAYQEELEIKFEKTFQELVEG